MLNTKSWRKTILHEQIEYMFDKLETVKKNVTFFLENKITEIIFQKQHKLFSLVSCLNAHQLIPWVDFPNDSKFLPDQVDRLLHYLGDIG